MRNMTRFYKRLPEFDLDQEAKELIYRFFLKLPEVDKKFECNNSFKDANGFSFIERMKSALAVESRAAFVFQKPYASTIRHVDLEENNRNTVIIVPVKMKTGTLFFEDYESNAVDQTDPQYSYLVNVKEIHEAHNKTPELRVSLQFMLDMDFDDALQLHEDGLLCTS